MEAELIIEPLSSQAPSLQDVVVLADEKSKSLKVFCPLCGRVYKEPYVTSCGVGRHTTIILGIEGTCVLSVPFIQCLKEYTIKLRSRNNAHANYIHLYV